MNKKTTDKIITAKERKALRNLYPDDVNPFEKLKVRKKATQTKKIKGKAKGK